MNIRTYTPKDLGGLVSSIQSVGVREPIIVRRSEDGTYQLLAGQRRRKASELAKKTTIPALVYEMTLEEARTYHKAQTLDPKTVIPGKPVTLSASEPSKAEEKPSPSVPAVDKDKLAPDDLMLDAEAGSWTPQEFEEKYLSPNGENGGR